MLKTKEQVCMHKFQKNQKETMLEFYKATAKVM